MVREFIGTEITGRIVEFLEVPDGALYGTLVGTQLVGMALLCQRQRRRSPKAYPRVERCGQVHIADEMRTLDETIAALQATTRAPPRW